MWVNEYKPKTINITDLIIENCIIIQNYWFLINKLMQNIIINVNNL